MKQENAPPPAAIQQEEKDSEQELRFRVLDMAMIYHRRGDSVLPAEDPTVVIDTANVFLDFVKETA